MRIYIVFLIAASSCAFPGRTWSQSNTAPLTDLRTTNDACFQLLDIAPSSVQHPGNPKEFTTALLSQIGSASALPKNFAFDVAPYWFTRPKNETVYKYLNANTNHTSAYYYTGILRKLTVSLASSFSDSTAGSLLANTNYYSAGIQTNLVTIRRGKNIDSIVKYISALRNEEGQCILLGKANGDSLRACMQRLATSDSTGLQTALNIIPAFQLDAAFAYSEAFSGNSYSRSRFNRTAGWVTATFGIPVGKKTNYFALLGLFKLLSDNVLTDTTHQIFQDKSAMDYGGKFTFTAGNFSLGIEYVQRSYSDFSKLNSHRCVGLVQYAVNKSIFLTGSFGQNFGGVNNLFSSLGINFGFGSKSESLPD